jgi:hypothetical protein
MESHSGAARAPRTSSCWFRISKRMPALEREPRKHRSIFEREDKRRIAIRLAGGSVRGAGRELPASAEMRRARLRITNRKDNDKNSDSPESARNVSQSTGLRCRIKKIAANKSMIVDALWQPHIAMGR